MLVRFVCENFKSIKSRIDFKNTCFIKKNDKKFISRMYKTNNDVGIPRLSAIFKEKDSKKDDFLNAINMSKNIILSNNIRKSDNKKTMFEYYLKIDDKIFSYGFILESNKISKEWLFCRDFGFNKEEILIFDRELEKIDFCGEYNNIVKNIKDNELLLYSLRNEKFFKKIYDWFKKIVFVNDIKDLNIKDDNIYLLNNVKKDSNLSLIKNTIKTFYRNKNESQLIFTTELSDLLNFNILRKDEIWFLSLCRNRHIFSYLYEFKLRKNMNIKKGFLFGRFMDLSEKNRQWKI